MVDAVLKEGEDLVTAMTSPGFIESLCITQTVYLQQFQLVRAGGVMVQPSKLHSLGPLLSTSVTPAPNKKGNLPKNINRNGPPYNSFDMVTPKIKKKLGRERGR